MISFKRDMSYHLQMRYYLHVWGTCLGVLLNMSDIKSYDFSFHTSYLPLWNQSSSCKKIIMESGRFYSPWTWWYELKHNMNIITLYNSLAAVCGTMYHMCIIIFWLVDTLFMGNTHVVLCELFDKQLYIIICFFNRNILFWKDTIM